MGTPVVWKSQLQMEIALSSAESKYTGLSYALREAIPLINIIKEIESMDITLNTTKTKISCKVFEDNSSVLEMVTMYKFRPWTKNINIKLHHFYDYVACGEITIYPISTENQLAEYLTKTVCEHVLVHLHRLVIEW